MDTDGRLHVRTLTVVLELGSDSPPSRKLAEVTWNYRMIREYARLFDVRLNTDGLPWVAYGVM